MLNVVKSLLYRLKKNKMFWIMLGVCAFLPVLTLLLNNLILQFADIFVDVPLDMGLEMTTYMTLSELVSLSSNANFFTLLCVSIFLCKEFTDGTIRNALLSNKSRVSLYAGYGITALTIGGSYLVTYFISTLLALGIPFGFGGIARIGEGDLPSDNILGEHVRLGSQSVILSRTFKGVVGVDKNARDINLKDEVLKVRNRLEEINNWTEDDFMKNKALIQSSVDKVVNKILRNHA
jgi:hypothetical protein